MEQLSKNIFLHVYIPAGLVSGHIQSTTESIKNPNQKYKVSKQGTMVPRRIEINDGPTSECGLPSPNQTGKTLPSFINSF